MRHELIRYGWSKARRWVWAFLPALLLQWVLSSAVTWRREVDGRFSVHLWWHNLGILGQKTVITAVVLSIVGYVASRWVEMGIIDGSVKVAHGEDVAAGDFFVSWKNLGNYVIGSFLFGFIVGVGTLLLVVPGIIWGLRYCLYGYYIVTQGAGPMEALQMSAEATDGHKSELFALCVASMGAIILGVLCLGVGLLWAIPTVDIAWGAVFLELSGQQSFPATEPT
ncbi:MAG: DUF975 family protein [Caldiserica bacterium]|nr:DUF975 family protein [Caldisericota bacterium]